MKQISKAINTAFVNATAAMTDRIRSTAIASGWDPEVASKVNLEYDGNKVSVNIHPDYRERVLDFEYGLEGVPPKHAIRKHLLHPTEFDNLVAKHMPASKETAK